MPIAGLLIAITASAASFAGVEILDIVAARWFLYLMGGCLLLILLTLIIDGVRRFLGYWKKRREPTGWVYKALARPPEPGDESLWLVIWAVSKMAFVIAELLLLVSTLGAWLLGSEALDEWANAFVGTVIANVALSIIASATTRMVRLGERLAGRLPTKT